MSKPSKTKRSVAARPADTAVSARLVDGNVLVALADLAHVHHDAAVDWFTSFDGPFATCPITQGTLVRMLLRFNAVPEMEAAVGFLARLTGHSRHRFWPDSLSYTDIAWRGIFGQRQVTDAYLAALARHHGGRLVTFDHGLAALHADVVDLVVPA